MKIELGDSVRSSDDHNVGVIKHLILDPSTSTVKTLVVQKGWLLPDDIEVPLSAVQQSSGDTLRIAMTATQMQQLPRFDESLYTPVQDQQLRLFPGIPYGGVLWPFGYNAMPFPVAGFPLPVSDIDSNPQSMSSPVTDADIDKHEAQSAVISAGDDVYSQDGEKVGEIHSVALDSDSGRATSLVIRRGDLFVEDTTLSGDVIASVEAGAVYLSLDQTQLKALQERGAPVK